MPRKSFAKPSDGSSHESSDSEFENHDMNAADIIAILAAYLLGAVPFGLLVGKTRGVDIREHGSHNIGATNAVRVLGKPLGITVFFLDALKGFIPSFFFPAIANDWQAIAMSPVHLSLACGAAAIMGHNFPVYLRFKGGKGVATSAGVLFGIAWLTAVISLGVWVLAFLISRYVSLASILGALTVAVSSWILYSGAGVVRPIVLTVLALLIIIRHKSNIARLMSGTESRFVKKKS